MNRHRIRLRKPWQCETVAEGAIWRRRFGCPSALGPGETVWLCCDGELPDTTLALNGEELSRPSRPATLGCHDVTTRLCPRNTLEIRAFGSAVPAQESVEPPFDVYLEIRCR